MTAYYNELDPYVAEWLRNLIAAGHIADGVVDNRSISEVEPNDLRDFTQCHFFAGIGVWSYALRLAGWPDERPVWTGSCPCQPFSIAGLAGGFSDERHLWPHWHHLIRECRPPEIFGEQVASKDGLAWLDLVQTDLEGEGYAFAPFDLCAAGVGAPHIRQRLFFVADAGLPELSGWRNATADHDRRDGTRCEPRSVAASRGAVCGMGHHHHQRLQARELETLFGTGRRQEGGAALQPGGAFCQLGDTQQQQRSQGCGDAGSGQGVGEARAQPTGVRADGATGPTNGHWRDADWLFCRDGKWRPVEPGTFPLAHGATARVGRLRAYGNAIVAQVAAEMIAAYMECRP